VELIQADFVMPRDEITTEYGPGTAQHVQLHDGSMVTLRKVTEEYDPTNRDEAYATIRSLQAAGEVPTGLIYISPDSVDMMEQLNTVPGPLYDLPFESLCPGAAELDSLQTRFR
jgi:2-oxoglutarate ferredoxin oxidoreductase subunit beta